MRLTLLGRADEVPDAPNTAIILALGFIQLHAHPLATGELRGPAEPQRARLEETREDMAWVALGGHDKITGIRFSVLKAAGQLGPGTALRPHPPTHPARSLLARLLGTC